MVYPVSPEIIKQAGDILANQGIVAFPTETVYGLGASVYSDSAIQLVFAQKGRPADNPLIAHVASWEQFEDLVVSCPGWMRTLLEQVWPGPLSVVLPHAGRVAERGVAGLDTVAVRWPNHPVAEALIRQAGVPLFAPSANLSGRPSPTRAEHVRQDFGGRIMIVDGGICRYGLESTVVIPRADRLEILRPGGMSREALQLACPVEVISQVRPDPNQAPRTPGQKYRHYAPRAQVRLVSVDQLPRQLSAHERVLSPIAIDQPYQPLTAETLYHSLRQADQDGIEQLWLVADTIDTNSALWNRVEKITEFENKVLV